jgi:integrase
MVNRYQRGGVYLRRGKKGDVWYGTWRYDLDGKRQSKKFRLGTKLELPTKVAARKRLDELVNGKPAPLSSMSVADAAARWEKGEGSGMEPNTLKHYTDALRAYVLPTLGERSLETIQREDITSFLNDQAQKYSRSALKSMRLVLTMVLQWAERNKKIERPTGWLDGIRLPKLAGGRKLVRADLTPQQTLAIIAELEEPYATLVLFLSMGGRRIEEAIGLKPGDLDDGDILHIRRIIYEGRVQELEKEQVLPLDSPEHADLVRRLRALGAGHEWVFNSRKGTPINPGNARRRYLHPAAEAIGIKVGGWHDFRHGLQRAMREKKVDPVIRAGVMDHRKVELGPEVYDHATLDEKREALRLVARELLPIGSSLSMVQ